MRGVLHLASTSPRRRELLSRAGIAFRLLEPGPEVEGSGPPRERAVQRARSKSEQAPAPADPGPVLGVDTVVVLDADTELGKPADRDAARAMLCAMLGREHEVVTAHCLVDPTTRASHEECATSTVRCRTLGEAEIEAYLDTGDWTDKAGAYGIQSAAAGFMQLVTGELDTVIGLHVAAVRRLMAQVP